MKQNFVSIAVLLVLVGSVSAAPYNHFVNNLLGLSVAGNTQTVLASCFTDSTGSRDNNLYAGDFYAELSINYQSKDFKALGGLPFGYKLRITYNGKSIIATKGDVGAGGPNHPKIDIHKKAAQALGINSCDNFLANVQIEFLG